ncbi:MAG: hypothetical protein MJ245_04225 [Clostridia bacterium]|nr:hypothetical protein [Clostridia bacterium]
MNTQPLIFSSSSLIGTDIVILFLSVLTISSPSRLDNTSLTIYNFPRSLLLESAIISPLRLHTITLADDSLDVCSMSL